MQQKKTTLYQSELVQMGTVRAIVATDVTPSKYPNKPEWVMLNIGGEDRRYDCENPACADAFRGLRGSTVLITATGSREAAGIIVENDDGAAPAPAPARQAPPAARPPQAAPQRQAPAANHAPAPAAPSVAWPVHPTVDHPAANHAPAPAAPRAGGDPVIAAKRNLLKLANGYRLCMNAANYVRHGWDVDHPSAPMLDEQFQAMVSTLFIGADKRGTFDNLPAELAE